jgi:hypothetical protein
MAESPPAVEAPDLVLRPATVADIPAFRALGEAVVPPTYGPIDIWLRKTLRGAR